MDYYEILGVSPNASDAVIRVVYRQRLKEAHPDTGTNDVAELDAVKEAGEVLLSTRKRAAYDEELAFERLSDLADSDSSEVNFRRIAGGLIAVSLIALAFVVFGSLSRDDATATSQSSVVNAAGADEEPEAVADDDTTATVTLGEPTAEPPAEPTAVPTAVPTAAPTAEATAVPTAEPTAVPTAEPTVEPTVAPTPAPTAVPTSEPTAAETTEASADADGEQTDTEPSDLPDLEELPERGAIYRAPTLFLVGPVPSQEIADAFYAKAVAVLGEENVVNEYVVHPDAPTDLNGNVRVEQAIQFETASAAIRPEFIPVLGLALEVLTQNPQASLVIAGHTDSIGTAENNQALSERRALAVVDWLAGQGIDRSRLSAVGYGESQPVADNLTEIGRSINRRIEVEITDLLS